MCVCVVGVRGVGNRGNVFLIFTRFDGLLYQHFSYVLFTLSVLFPPLVVNMFSVAFRAKAEMRTSGAKYYYCNNYFRN